MRGKEEESQVVVLAAVLAGARKRHAPGGIALVDSCRVLRCTVDGTPRGSGPEGKRQNGPGMTAAKEVSLCPRRAVMRIDKYDDDD